MEVAYKDRISNKIGKNMELIKKYSNNKNVQRAERAGWLAGGGSLILYGLKLQSLGGLGLALLGGGLLYRGIRGSFSFRSSNESNWIDSNFTISGKGSESENVHDMKGRKKNKSKKDAVELASDDSFPASDPPGWTSGSSIPTDR